jgi:hypothetical protein
MFFYLNKESGIRIKYVIIIFVTGVLITSVIDRGYHYLYHNHFKSEPGTGIWMVAPSIYISNLADTTVLKTQLEKEYFKAVYSKSDSNNLTLRKYREGKKLINVSTDYSEAWGKICWETAFPVMGIYIKENDSTNLIFAYDKFVGGIANKLILKNYKNYILLISNNFVKTFYSNGYFILFMSLLLIMISQLLSNLTNKEIFASLAILFIAIGNNFLLSLLLYPDVRLQIYSDTILNLQLIIFCFYALKSFLRYNFIKTESVTTH